MAGESKLNLRARTTSNAGVDLTPQGYRLRIPAGDSSAYRFAQLDDYIQLPRKKFPHRSLSLSLRARVSSSSLPGTWGFGLWNDPFGLSLGFGGSPFRLPALPNAIWFFHASKENHLSFSDKPGNGFLAQTFNSPCFHPLLIPAGLVFPFSRKWTRKLLGKVIKEDSVDLWNAEARFRESTSKLIDSIVDPIEWHEYKLEWSQKRCAFWVDGKLVLETPVSPRSPLGVVIWIDNQYAAFTPEGKIGFGLLSSNDEWLEIENLKIKRGPD